MIVNFRWNNEKEKILQERRNRQATEISSRPDLSEQEMNAVGVTLTFTSSYIILGDSFSITKTTYNSSFNLINIFNNN